LKRWAQDEPIFFVRKRPHNSVTCLSSLQNDERESGSGGSFGVKRMKIPTAPKQGREFPVAGKTAAARSSDKERDSLAMAADPKRDDAGRRQACPLCPPCIAKKGLREVCRSSSTLPQVCGSSIASWKRQCKRIDGTAIPQIPIFL